MQRDHHRRGHIPTPPRRRFTRRHAPFREFDPPAYVSILETAFPDFLQHLGRYAELSERERDYPDEIEHNLLYDILRVDANRTPAHQEAWRDQVGQNISDETGESGGEEGAVEERREALDDNEDNGGLRGSEEVGAGRAEGQSSEGTTEAEMVDDDGGEDDLGVSGVVIDDGDKEESRDDENAEERVREELDDGATGQVPEELEESITEEIDDDEARGQVPEELEESIREVSDDENRGGAEGGIEIKVKEEYEEEKRKKKK